MEYDKNEHNLGLRALAKITLISMWGKFGQRLNKEFNDPQAFHRFLDTDTLDTMYVVSPSSTTMLWNSTFNINKKTSLCHSTSTSSWLVSPPVGRVFISTRLWNSWENARSTSTPTQSFTSKNPDNPTLAWETISESSPVNWMGTITMWNSCQEAPRIMGPKPRTEKLNAKSVGSVSTAKAKPN